MFTPALSRAARGLLDWSQTDLATKAGVSLSTVRDFETGKRSPIANNLTAMQRAIEEAGIQFIPENGGGPGVRLRTRDGRPAIGAPPTVEEKGDVIGEP
jgi:transcriptional regulator with XRE-family HTH domain